MINTNGKKIAALQAENEKLKQDIEELKKHNQEQQEAVEHAEVQEKLISEFDMSQEEFNTKLIKALEAPEVVSYLGRMLQNVMSLGLGR